jgi:hypothetical protein
LVVVVIRRKGVKKMKVKCPICGTRWWKPPMGQSDDENEPTVKVVCFGCKPHAKSEKK